MSSNSTLSNIVKAAPTQQPTNNSAASRISQENSFSQFQQTLDDVRAAKEEKSTLAETKAVAAAKQKSKNNETIVKNNHTKVNENSLRQKALKSTDNVQRPASDLQNSGDNTNQINDKSKTDISDNNKFKNENGEEKKQDDAEQSITDIAAPISTTEAMGLGIVDQAVDPILANDETVGLILGSFVFTSTPTTPVASSLTENELLNNVGNFVSTSFNIDVASNNVFNPNSPTSSEIIEDALEASTTLAKSVPNIAAIISMDSVSLKNLSNLSAAFNDESLLISDQQTTNTVGSKSLFEKMVQIVSVKQMGATNTTFDQAAGEGGNNSPMQNTNTATPLVSAMDSLNRGSDSLLAAGRSFVAQTAIPVTVGQPQWSQAVGEKVLWLAAQNITAAEIRLDPPDLGPMQVKVSINQDQASVSFTSHHAGVREALDQNLNRLRDMFNEQGLNLVNVDVSDKSFHRQQSEGKGAQSHEGSADLVDDETCVSVSAIVQQRLVDHYA